MIVSGSGFSFVSVFPFSFPFPSQRKDCPAFCEYLYNGNNLRTHCLSSSCNQRHMMSTHAVLISINLLFLFSHCCKKLKNSDTVS